MRVPGSEHLSAGKTTSGMPDVKGKRASLRSFLRPRSIAVVGASDSTGKVGLRLMKNLVAAGFPGEIYPVNPGRDRVMDRKAYQAISFLPQAPELVVIATPAESAPAIVEE